MKVGLLVVERLNSLTLKRVALIGELERRKAKGAHKCTGEWRHEFYLESLKSKIDLLERQRKLLFEKVTPR